MRKCVARLSASLAYHARYKYEGAHFTLSMLQHAPRPAQTAHSRLKWISQLGPQFLFRTLPESLTNRRILSLFLKNPLPVHFEQTNLLRSSYGA